MTESDKATANQQEPSMEDILASIRRILSEGDDGQQTPSAGEASEGEGDASARGAPETSEVEKAPMTVEDGSMRNDNREHQDFEKRNKAVDAVDKDAEPDIEFADVLDLTPSMRTGPVLSPPASAASSDALAQLAKAILDRRDMAIGSRDVTLEGMVREMLRPLLKEWLDRNLPYLIERLVKKEIDFMVNRAERLED
jgi:uncharacterized protein